MTHTDRTSPAEIREQLRGMALSLATGSGPIVEPATFDAALDAYRDAVLAEPAAVSAAVAPPTNRAELRDRVAAALYRHEWPRKQVWEQALAMDREVFEAMADAVLAVLPEPTDRTAVLREAADAVRDGDLGPRDGMSRDYENGWWNSRAAAEQRIRSLADADQESAPTTDQQVRAVQAWMALDLHQA
ncbi:hypothetical protein ADL27_63250, partial [Streptomyces sp. NRRL F-6602]